MNNITKAYLSTLQQLHKRFFELMDVTDEQLFIIPKGYKNNIFWNYCHAIVTQESLLYSLSGNESYFDKEIINRFKGGTVPTEEVDMKMMHFMKKASLEILKKLEAHLVSNEAFSNFQTYHLGLFDYDLNNIEEALQFNQIHMSIHLGYALAIKKLV